MTVIVRPARLADAARVVEHLFRHMAESGRGGSPYFGPPPVLSPAECLARLTEGMSRGLDEPGWERTFLLVELAANPLDADAIVGHGELRTDGMPSRQHRASLGMGIERAYTGRGHGPRLLDAIVGFARNETQLAWIDLGVVADNRPARVLYERFGFVATGRVDDMFRLPDGTRIDDIQMTLAIDRGAG
jgi:ribosomal protein S18 acetylase RimI-like enzyme